MWRVIGYEGQEMKIALASGKGGTGKTTFSTNLAFWLSKNNIPVTFLDCDVEAPNAHLFLKPNWQKKVDVSIAVPSINKVKCTNCGICSRACEFKAIANPGTDTLVFSELCHGCGLCSYICPEAAITEVPKRIGVIKEGNAGSIDFIHGRLKIGEPLSTPLIKKVRQYDRSKSVTIIDAPPGTSCTAIASVYGVDFVLLVTEPTPFGLNDLILAVEMVKALNLPYAVAVNRSDIGDRKVWDYCDKEGIDIMMELPHAKAIAELYSKGELILRHLSEYDFLFKEIFKKIRFRVES
jgi:MinD superfamily P-loop ATPase